MHQLTQLVEEFFVLQELKQRQTYRKHLLLDAFLNRHLLTFFDKNYQKIEAQQIFLDKKGILKKGHQYYFEQYLLNFNYLDFLQFKKYRKLNITDVNRAENRLTQHYLIHRCYILALKLSLQTSVENEMTDDFLKVLEKELNEKTSDSNPLLILYRDILMLLLQKETALNYLDIIKKLEETSRTIPKKELNGLYTILTNYFIGRGRKGENYHKILFDLYKKMADSNVLFIGTHLSAGMFKNIVTLSCIFEEFDWATDFIQKHQQYLFIEQRSNIYHFNMGVLCFYQKQYHQAQEHLIQVNNFDVFYNIDTKSLLLRIYIETQQLYPAEQLIPSFKDYIRKQKQLSPKAKKAYNNFINMTSRIIKAQFKPTSNTKLKTNLLKKLNSYELIHHKNWLEEKINGEL